MFVVTVLHNTGHGEQGSAVLVTEDPRQAVETARSIENYGYQFYARETSVTVSRLEPGRVYSKQDSWSSAVYLRTLSTRNGDHRSGRVWNEEWLDAEFGQKFGEPLKQE